VSRTRDSIAAARGCKHPRLPDEPAGYIAWHEWAEEKAKTHTQRQCQKCRLWVFWDPKDGGLDA
jgi:hypothetical protein